MTRSRRRPLIRTVAIAALAACLAACASRQPAPPKAPPAPKTSRAPHQRTVADVLRTIGPRAEARLRSRFASRGVPYPPPHVDLLAFKDEQRLELWAPAGGRSRRVAVFPLLDDSGVAGPKLREGDWQIPEGIYRVTWLHPNSHYHLSMKLDYPNAFDRARAREEGRTDLGGDIFIHGSDVSIGCLAIGDPAIEELFVLAARVGKENLQVVIAPWDFRRRPAPRRLPHQPEWTSTLYAQLAAALASFR